MSDHNLSDEERAKLGLLADRLMHVVAERHGVSVQEVIEATRWVHTHKEFVTKMKSGGLIGLITFLITASLLALWEGIKASVSGGQK